MKLPAVVIFLWAAVCLAQAAAPAPRGAQSGAAPVKAVAPAAAPPVSAAPAAAVPSVAAPAKAAAPSASATGAPATAAAEAVAPSVAGARPAPEIGEPAPRVAAPDPLRASPPTMTDGTGSELTKLETDDELNMGWTLLRTFVVLGVVLMSIYITLNWGMRRLMGIKGPLGATSLVSVLERVPLDQKRSLFVVKAGSEYLLLGGTDGSLSLLSKLDTAEVEKLRTERAAAPTLTLSPFLQKLLTRRGPRT